MFWILLTIISLAVAGFFTYLLVKTRDFVGSTTALWTVFAFALVMLLAFWAEGGTDYRDLLKKRATWQALEMYRDEIKAVKGTDIRLNDLEVESGAATRKICYLENLADAAAAYNSYLVRCKHVLNHRSFWWFREGLFMNRMIIEMTPITVNVKR